MTTRKSLLIIILFWSTCAWLGCVLAIFLSMWRLDKFHSMSQCTRQAAAYAGKQQNVRNLIVFFRGWKLWLVQFDHSHGVSCISAVTSPNPAFPLGVIYLLKGMKRHAEHLRAVRYGCTFAPSHSASLLHRDELFFRFVAHARTIPYAASPSLHTLWPIKRYANPSWNDLVLKVYQLWKPLLFHTNSIFLSCLASPR